jgi:small neutral amino acid transporter SnatA (MarC family)
LPLVLSLAAFLLGTTANLIICWNSWRLYEDVSALPPEAELWLGGRGISVLLIGLATPILVAPLSIAGFLFSDSQRRYSTAILSVLAVVLALAPVPLDYWLTQKIIAATGVVLAQ